MKERAQSILGYLAAFTLGVICMGTIFLVARERRAAPAPGPTPNAAPPGEPATAVASPPSQQTFQRLPHRPFQPPLPQAPAEREEALPFVEQDDSTPVVAVPFPVPTVVRQVAVRSNGPDRPSVAGAAGRISGKVRFLIEPPAEKELPLDPTCAAKRLKQKLPAFTHLYTIGKDRGLADVAVSLRAGLPEKTWDRSYQPLKISQEACDFSPYVSAVQAGQTITVENRDAVLHHLRLSSVANGEFDRAELPHGHARFTFREPEDFIRFSCDVHPWEFAYVSVFDHPFFAVTDKNGEFLIPSIPPGTYTIEARHRKAGVLAKEITVEANRNVDLHFDFEAPL